MYATCGKEKIEKDKVEKVIRKKNLEEINLLFLFDFEIKENKNEK